ncbi:shematrin-like protein 1 [Drosophila eugracilis]|uniref:shematrin-like protein 1 n=1 Tax=Drosophila eugracilis TaxID=29029 RepID=UPI0007E66309|nr:shematrin-like protein 1 [Drosophila eugracilis]
MFLLARLAPLSLLFLMVSGQKSKSKVDRPQGRTLGLLTPLLLGGGGPLFDAPLPVGPPIRPGSSSAGGGGTQSDPQDYGGSYPSYGYRPNYGYGYGYPSYGYNYGYPGLGYGYGQSYYRPSYYNYGGYQRPQPYYGYRPNYSSISAGASAGYPSYGGGYGSSASISSSPSYTPATSAVGVGTGAGAGAAAGIGNTQLTTAQQAQLAGILGQALGSSLRPLLANGGGAAGATGAGANPQALSGLLSLLG